MTSIPRMIGQPKLSVIVTVYQMEDYLKECLDSIIRQSFKDIEIILVDDGSEDASGVICDSYASSDSRIKVLHQRNQGLVAARKSGLNLATSSYILYVDADDWIDQDHLEQIWRALEEHPCDLLYTSYKTVSPDGRKRVTNSPVLQGYYGPSDMDSCLSRVFGHLKEGNIGIAYPWQRVVRKEILASELSQMNGQVTILEGTLLSLKLLSAVRSVYYDDKLTGYNYRVREGSMSRMFPANAMEQYSAYIAEIEQVKLPQNAAAMRDEQMNQIAYVRIIRLIRHALSNGSRASYHHVKNLRQQLLKDSVLGKYMGLPRGSYVVTDRFDYYQMLIRKHFLCMVICKYIEYHFLKGNRTR